MAARGILILEDGTRFRGRSFGAEGEVCGEVVFNTSLTGYQEILTDPSYSEQIVAMTCPQIGNTGVNSFDVESGGLWLHGFVVREYTSTPSNWRAQGSLGDYLVENGIIAVEGIDTRMLVLRIRRHGAMRGIISTVDFEEESLLQKVNRYPGLVGRDLVRGVTTGAGYGWQEGPYELFDCYAGGIGCAADARPVDNGDKHHVVAYDFGIKRNILRLLVGSGCRVTVVPASTSAEDVLALNPQGIFLSNGPGDPEGVSGVRENIMRLMNSEVPLFGICLGHQILALAAGGRTFKLKFGHRGANQPVKDLDTGKVEITSQNHGFAVEEDSLDKTGFKVSHINLNDRTVEGMIHESLPVFSVQYHPEASPGPHDASHLFGRFKQMMERKNASS